MSLLVLQEEVTALMNNQTASRMNKDNLFEKVEAEAAIIIRDLSGITLPDDPATRDVSLDWVLTPMAWIMEYILLPLSDFSSDSERLAVKDRYNEAKGIASRNRSITTNADPTIAHLGTMEGLY